MPTRENAPPLVELRGVSKQYSGAGGAGAARPCAALRDINLTLAEGEFVAVVGRSGSGKTTLVNLLTGIDSATTGSIRVGDTLVQTLSQHQLARWRGTGVGIVFQFFQLLPVLTVAENVMLPMDFNDTYPASERRERALHLLAEMDIAEQADKTPCELSGGQQQRAAIARALANDPPLIVADEPTGNLDSHTAHSVLGCFARLVRAGKTVIVVSHETDLARYAARPIVLVDGVLQS